jgi:hypothetical protein
MLLLMFSKILELAVTTAVAPTNAARVKARVALFGVDAALVIASVMIPEDVIRTAAVAPTINAMGEVIPALPRAVEAIPKTRAEVPVAG